MKITKQSLIVIHILLVYLIASGCGGSEAQRNPNTRNPAQPTSPKTKPVPQRVHPGRHIPLNRDRSKSNYTMEESEADNRQAIRINPSIGDHNGPIHNTESYDRIYENEFLQAQRNPLSTFSVDVDTASYSIVRRFLNRGQLPPPGAVRIEELINYFNYQYTPPSGSQPFAVHSELSQAPWNPEHQLLKIGIKGQAIESQTSVPRTLVFLLDVSGSMNSPDKLPLLKKAMRMLTRQMNARDRVAIVVYAGASGLVLPPVEGQNQKAIMEALDRLSAGGSTNGGQGIQLAYKIARQHFHKEGVNRVILATDGDFNVGTTNQSKLIRMIEKERESGIFLTVLGFGSGNYKDSTMEKLADKGNGNYAYIDNISEARKVLVEQIGATLVTIAKDVKLQIEFNPAQVESYRLIGYENRMLKAEDFNNDKKDAGEIGAGHSVTALYEIVPKGQSSAGGSVDPLRYQKPGQLSEPAHTGELALIKMRYKAPQGSQSKLLEFPVSHQIKPIAKCSPDMRLAAAVASYGMLLRQSEHKGKSSFADVQKLARSAISPENDQQGYRAEFIRLAQMAGDLQSSTP